METLAAKQADYVGVAAHHIGLHGAFHESFDADFLRLLETWHYAFQYRLMEAKHGSVEDAAYEKLIAEIGPNAPALAKDALLAARSV